jgi:pimeloyl-ACP methyl ester carboxylesterase
MKNKTNLISKKEIQIPKIIRIIASLLQIVNPKWATLFAVKLFTTPIKHRIPNREIEMENSSKQEFLYIKNLNLKINTYRYGNSENKILLIHGWSGRGTQLFKIADKFIKNGYQTISFDAPAHGKSEGKTAIMNNFMECVFEIDKKYGPFKYAVCHSLGGMTLINCLKNGLQIEKGAIIGSGNSIQNILFSFIEKLELPKIQAIKMKDYFEKKYSMEMESFSTYRAAKFVETPILIIHDKNDEDIPVNEALHIHENLKNSELFTTEGLGHRKILGDKNVVDKIFEFVTN